MKYIKDICLEKFWLMPATPEFIERKEIPYITSKNIKKGKIDFSNVNYISTDIYKSLIKNRNIQVDDILISMIGTIGEVAIVDKNCGDFYGQNLYLLRLNKDLAQKRYIYYFFNSGYVKHILNISKNSSTQGYLKAGMIDNLKIPLPSIEEQKKIANTLDKVTNLIELRKKQLEKLDIFSKALFVEMFGDPVENPMNWKKEKLMNLGTLKNGVNFNLTNKGFKIYCLGVSDFKDLNIINNIESLSTITLQKKPPEDYLLKNGDIVFVRSNGNKLLVGRSVLICNNNILTTFSGFCIRFRLTSNRIVNIYYLLTLLKSDFMRNKMRGRGANIQNLNQKILSDLDIFIPPIELQNKFAKRVKHIDKIKLDIQDSLNKLETLKKSLMQEYFS